MSRHLEDDARVQIEQVRRRGGGYKKGLNKVSQTLRNLEYDGRVDRVVERGKRKRSVTMKRGRGYIEQIE